jgi:hypothetical protein
MERFYHRRVKEATATGSNVRAIACAYEASRFEHGPKVLECEKRMFVRDVTELLAESLGGK